MNNSSVENTSHNSAFKNFENRVMVILEDFREQFKILAEGQIALFQRQERTDQKLDEMEGRLTHRLTSVELDMQEVKECVIIIEKKMVTKDDIKPLERRVSKLEKEAFL